MNLENFLKGYQLTGSNFEYCKKYEDAGKAMLDDVDQLKKLFTICAGSIFEKGLLKIHNWGSSYYWTDLTFGYFKQYKGNAYCFAFDWMGRQFALNLLNGKEIILMLDPAEGKAFKLEVSIEEFFNADVAEGKQDMFDIKRFRRFFGSQHQNVFKRFFGSQKQDFFFDHCVGFIKPLALGGKDVFENLEDWNMDVYWEINCHVHAKTANLPLGTRVNLKIK